LSVRTDFLRGRRPSPSTALRVNAKDGAASGWGHSRACPPLAGYLWNIVRIFS